MSIPIGEHLRAVRKSRVITLKQLSEETGLSIGYLSNVERDIVSPTITVLSDICQALGVDLTAFLQPFSPKAPVLKHQERETVYRSDSLKVQYESITPNGFRMKGLRITLAAGGSSGDTESGANTATPHSHNSDEFGIVEQGTLTLFIGERTYTLETGDSFCLDAHTPHWFKNAGKSVCIFYSVTA